MIYKIQPLAINRARGCIFNCTAATLLAALVTGAVYYLLSTIPSVRSYMKLDIESDAVSLNQTTVTE
jgi:hypothetical protein